MGAQHGEGARGILWPKAVRREIDRLGLRSNDSVKAIADRCSATGAMNKQAA